MCVCGTQDMRISLWKAIQKGPQECITGSIRMQAAIIFRIDQQIATRCAASSFFSRPICLGLLQVGTNKENQQRLKQKPGTLHIYFEIVGYQFGESKSLHKKWVKLTISIHKKMCGFLEFQEQIKSKRF